MLIKSAIITLTPYLQPDFCLFIHFGNTVFNGRQQVWRFKLKCLSIYFTSGVNKH